MLLLASASPRRRELLTSAGMSFTVSPGQTDETWTPGELPRAYVLRVARAKARECAHRCRSFAPFLPAESSGPVEDAKPAALHLERCGPGRILAADTTVALGDRVLGKPVDAAHAAAMLADLAGRDHHVHTAVVLLDGARETHRMVTTLVRFRALTASEIEAYIATGEPFDKAGGYGIQGRGGALVDVVRGSYTNVVGLPLAETLTLLNR